MTTITQGHGGLQQAPSGVSHPKEQMQTQCLPEQNQCVAVPGGIWWDWQLLELFPPHRPGSLICHGDLVFQHPAPTSLEVLEALVLSVGPNKALAGSDFQVDPYSLAVGGKCHFGAWVKKLIAPCRVSRVDPQPARSRSLRQGEGEMSWLLR